MDVVQIAASVLLPGLAWFVSHALCNLYLHPLAGFPGAKLGCCSTLYKAWIDIVAQGSFVHTLGHLYKK